MMYKFFRRSPRGFTLIELLVVMAIIGVLAASAFASLTTARAKGRDSRRLQELQQLQKSIELYFATYNQYPVGCNGTAAYSSAGGTLFNLGGSCSSAFITGLAPTYIPKLPVDPSGLSVDGYVYWVDASRQNYKIMNYNSLETYTKTKGEVNSRCPTSCANTYCTGAYIARYTAGAACI